MMKDLEGKIKEYQGRYDTLVSAQADALIISQLAAGEQTNLDDMERAHPNTPQRLLPY